MSEIEGNNNDAKATSLKIAVVSDLHAYDTLSNGEEKPSHLCISDPEDKATLHPITGLHDLIEKRGLSADILMCCGDMGDKARPAGIKYVWDKLHNLKNALKAEKFVVTSGNHDVDSRYMYNDYDAKGVLQSLLPIYPLPDEYLSDKYWSRNYVILTEEKYRLIILNSSAYHGTKPEELRHGRVTTRTIEALREELAKLEEESSKDVNILLCHHHPHKHGDIEDADYSVMEGGHKLLELLGSGDFGNWIIIHGHKHHPRICYAAGSSSAPVVFSAGSLCATLYPDLQSVARNQFYIIDFPLDEIPKLNLGLVGTFESWDWAKGLGWQPAKENSGLPSLGGFGNRNYKAKIVKSIDSILEEKGEPYFQWQELVKILPGLIYLLPNDLGAVIKKLKIDHNIEVLRDSDGQPAQIGKKK